MLGLTLVACGNDDSAHAKTSSADAVSVTGDFDGKAVSLAPGQTLEVSLAANPSTGYQWDLIDLDQTVLDQAGDPDYRPAADAGNAAGIGGTSRWRFTAKTPGATALHLGYARPWEAGTEPAQHFTLTVTVAP
nr:protease inhibitor I42 family protein [Nocardia transvalensis]